VFAKVLWSGNLNKEFWLSSGCCKNAAVIGCSAPLKKKRRRRGRKKKERPVTLFGEAC
jgi:hypothetical protein